MRLAKTLALTGALTLSLVRVAQADGWIDLDASIINYSNLTRAQNPEDRRSDRALALNFSGGHYIAFSGVDGISLTLDARAEHYRRYSGLDFNSIGGSAIYRRKFGLGTTVPWVSASVSVARDDYRENMRDSNRLRAAAELGQRLSESFDVAVGGALDRRYGKSDIAEVPGYSGRVFDLQGVSAYARLGYAVNAKLLLGAQFSARRGDVESTARQSSAIFMASDAIADDPAFRADDLYGYRLPATTYSGVLTASWALSDQSSINFIYAGNRTRAGYGLAYNDRAFIISIAYRYP